VDCVVRSGELPDSELVARRIASLQQVTMASAGYVRRHGLPTSLADLHQGHLAVNWASPNTRRAVPLEFTVGRVVREVSLPSLVTVNGSDAYAACCEAGLGIAQFPRYRFGDALASGNLVALLTDMPPPPMPLQVAYLRQRQLPLRLRVFIDWVAGLVTTLA